MKNIKLLSILGIILSSPILYGGGVIYGTSTVSYQTTSSKIDYNDLNQAIDNLVGDMVKNDMLKTLNPIIQICPIESRTSKDVSTSYVLSYVTSSINKSNVAKGFPQCDYQNYSPKSQSIFSYVLTSELYDSQTSANNSIYDTVVLKITLKRNDGMIWQNEAHIIPNQTYISTTTPITTVTPVSTTYVNNSLITISSNSHPVVRPYRPIVIFGGRPYYYPAHRPYRTVCPPPMQRPRYIAPTPRPHSVNVSRPIDRDGSNRNPPPNMPRR